MLFFFDIPFVCRNFVVIIVLGCESDKRKVYFFVFAHLHSYKNDMKHDNSISVMRVAAMIMIVAYHCFCYNAGIWDFSNPITYNGVGLAVINDLRLLGLNFFVLISGMLYSRIEATGKYNDTKNFLINKVKRLLIPYIIWGIILCVIFLGRKNPIDILYGISHLWFLLMLFEVFVIIALTKAIWKKQGLKGSLLILLVFMIIDVVVSKLTYVFHIPDIMMLLDWQRALEYLPLFYIGVILEKFNLYEKLHFNVWCKLIIAMSLFIVTVLFSSNLHIHFTLIGSWFSTSLLFILVYNLLSTSGFTNGYKRRTVLMLLDKYSMAIYIVHHILIFVYLDYVPNAGAIMTNHYLLAPLAMFAILLPLSLIISVMLSYLPGAKYIIGISKDKVHK